MLRVVCPVRHMREVWFNVEGGVSSKTYEEEKEEHQGQAQDVRIKEVGVRSSPGGGAPPFLHTPPTIKHPNIEGIPASNSSAHLPPKIGPCVSQMAFFRAMTGHLLARPPQTPVAPTLPPPRKPHLIIHLFICLLRKPNINKT
jgi:hypothetical protein